MNFSGFLIFHYLQVILLVSKSFQTQTENSAPETISTNSNVDEDSTMIQQNVSNTNERAIQLRLLNNGSLRALIWVGKKSMKAPVVDEMGLTGLNNGSEAGEQPHQKHYFVSIMYFGEKRLLGAPQPGATPHDAPIWDAALELKAGRAPVESIFVEINRPLTVGTEHEEKSQCVNLSLCPEGLVKAVPDTSSETYVYTVLIQIPKALFGECPPEILAL